MLTMGLLCLLVQHASSMCGELALLGWQSKQDIVSTVQC